MMLEPRSAERCQSGYRGRDNPRSDHDAARADGGVVFGDACGIGPQGRPSQRARRPRPRNPAGRAEAGAGLRRRPTPRPMRAGRSSSGAIGSRPPVRRARSRPPRVPASIELPGDDPPARPDRCCTRTSCCTRITRRLWDDQVLKEPLALRVCRATNHLKSTLLSGFTTIRDLGTEGAGYADVGLKQAVDQGIVPGPRMLVVDPGDRGHRQLRARRASRPSGTSRRAPRRPTGSMSLIRVVRDQIGRGADWIKVYADTAMGGGPVRPSFSQEELKLIVETAGSVRRPGGRPCDVEGRDAPRGAGRRRDDRARRRRRRRGLPADGRAGRGALPDAGRRPRPRPATAAGGPGVDPEPAAAARAREPSRRRWRRASPSPTAATWASSPTATARARSSSWSTTA